MRNPDLKPEIKKMQMLIEAGADINSTDYAGHTPLDLALNEGEKVEQLITWISQHGGKRSATNASTTKP